MFGRLMSISDELMWRYFELLSFRSMDEIEAWARECRQGSNPRDIKVRLAAELVERFHGATAARQAHESFIARFQKGRMPDDMPEKVFRSEGAPVPLSQLLKAVGLVTSTSEAMRMTRQGAVRIDGVKVSDPKLLIDAGNENVYQVGKRRFAKIRVE